MQTREHKGSHDDKLRWVDKRKGELEALRLQLHLGQAEAKEAFEEQKEELRNWVDKASDRLDEWRAKGGEKTEEAKRALDELRVQAALGKAETAEALHEEQKKLNHTLHDVKLKLGNVRESVKAKAGSAKDDVGETLDEMRTRFDLFRLHTKLGAMEAGDAWEVKKKEINSDIHELKAKMEKGKEVADDRWESFSNEMAEAWTHFKSAFRSS